MATYNLDTVAGAIALEIINPQLANRFERHYNVKAQAGLAVGDAAYFDIIVPYWVRTIVVQKRTDTVNADTLTVQCQDNGPTIPPVLPIKTANAIQVGGSTYNSAASSVLMQLYPVGNKVRVSLLLATSVPAQCMLTIGFYDA